MGGRLELPIDWNKVDELLIAGCTGHEIASHFDMHYNTLYRRVEEKYGMPYSEYSFEKRQKGDSILKHVQFEKAVSGDNSMLIWLGKNRLKQSDAPVENLIQNQIEDKFKKIMDHLENKNQSSESALSAAESNISNDK